MGSTLLEELARDIHFSSRLRNEIINEMGNRRRNYVSALPCSRNSGVPCFAFQWTFSYIGFPVELDTLYFIGAHNIPNANMNGDGPSLSVNFTSPGKLPHSSVILCLAGMLALGYVVCYREARVPWTRHVTSLSLGFLTCHTDTMGTAPHSQSGED